ncbi:MAG: hypothetical protein ABIT08_07185 [Bacteroidia bacterium]
MTRAVFVKAVVDDRTLNVDKYHDQSIDIGYVKGHYYSEKAPVPALMTMPIYFFLKKFGVENVNDRLIYCIGNFVAGSLPFALIVFMTFLYMQKVNPGAQNIFLSTLPFFGSFIFIYSGTFFAHTLTSFFVLMGYVLLKKKENYFLAGVVSGLAVLCEYPVVIIAVIWAIQIFANKNKLKPLLVFIAGGLPFGIFLMFYNWLLTGHPWEFMYSHQLNFPRNAENLGFRIVPDLKIFAELLFGIYRGILFFAPALIFLLIIFLLDKKTQRNYFFKDYLTFPCLLYFVIICFNTAWYGGWCYGPRYLSAIAVLLLFEGIMKMSDQPFSRKIFFYLFSGVGLILAYMAKSTVVYSLPTEEKNPVFNIIIPEFFKGNFNENNLLSLLFGADRATANLLWLPLFFAGLYFFYAWLKQITLKNISLK